MAATDDIINLMKGVRTAKALRRIQLWGGMLMTELQKVRRVLRRALIVLVLFLFIGPWFIPIKAYTWIAILFAGVLCVARGLLWRCPYCGKVFRVHGGGHFCPNCGKDIGIDLCLF